MTAPEIAEPVVMTRDGLDRLVEVLIADGYLVIGPTVRDSAIVLAELDSADALPAGWGVDTGPGHYRLRAAADAAVFAHSAGPGSWKQFLHPPRRQLWSTDSGRRRSGPPEPAVAALRVPRRPRLRPGGDRDPRPGARRGRSPRWRVRPDPPGPVRGRGELHRAGRGVLLRLDGDRARPPGPATTWPSPSDSTSPATGSWPRPAPPRVSASSRRSRTAALPLRKKKWRRQRSARRRSGWAGTCPPWTCPR